MTKEEFDKINVFGIGEPNVNFVQYFIGNSYLNHFSFISTSIY